MCVFATKCAKTGLLLLFMGIFLLQSLWVFSQEIEVYSQAKVIANGGSWFLPMNASSNKVALFSEQREPFSIYNLGSSLLNITSITLQIDQGVMKEEFTLQNTELKPGALDFKETAVEAKKSFDF